MTDYCGLCFRCPDNGMVLRESQHESRLTTHSFEECVLANVLDVAINLVGAQYEPLHVLINLFDFLKLSGFQTPGYVFTYGHSETPNTNVVY